VPSKHHAAVQQLSRDAESNYQAGKLDAAKRQYTAILALDSRSAPAHVRLAAIAYRQGDLRVAREQFEQAASLEPNNGRTQYNLAMLNLSEARQHLQDYMAIAREAPNRERVLTLLAQLDEFGSK
jgi:tetratricopeptide (TPR) repeat protein